MERVMLYILSLSSSLIVVFEVVVSQVCLFNSSTLQFNKSHAQHMPAKYKLTAKKLANAFDN